MTWLLKSGAPKPRRLAVQYGYETRPSFWQEVSSNAHLLIAAIGTAALIGLAAVAFWLAMPSNDRLAFAEPEPEPAKPVVVADATAAIPALAAQPATPVVAPKSDQVSPRTAAQEAPIAVLSSTDPRWSGTQTAGAQTAQQSAPPSDHASSFAKAEQPAAAGDSKAAPPAQQVAQAVEPAQAPTPSSVIPNAAAVVAPDPTDDAPTGAIAQVKPDAPTAKPAATPKQQTASSANDGRILRGVNMRAGPDNNAATITVLPAKTAVDVISCKQWCEVVFNGKRGWVYKTFVQRGG